MRHRCWNPGLALPIPLLTNSGFGLSCGQFGEVGVDERILSEKVDEEVIEMKMREHLSAAPPTAPDRVRTTALHGMSHHTE